MDRTIEVLNWEKFNGRGDVKHSSWFRMEHRILFHPDWAHLSGEELHVWTTVLGTCSFINKGAFRLDHDNLARTARIDIKFVASALEKLEALQCVRITEDAAAVRGTRTVRTRASTDGRTDGHTGAADASPFDDIYAAYPRRQGTHRRGEAFKTLAKRFASEEMQSKLLTAVKNYAAHCDAEKKTGTQYVLQFATFVNGTWEEFFDPAPGLLPPAAPKVRGMAEIEADERAANGGHA